MTVLIAKMEQMLKTQDPAQRLEAEHEFIEILTLSDARAIIAMLDKALTDDWIGFPVWARILAFRLACLLEPDNSDIRRRAAADLRSFGPDWDKQADQLEQEALEIMHSPA